MNFRMIVRRPGVEIIPQKGAVSRRAGFPGSVAIPEDVFSIIWVSRR